MKRTLLVAIALVISFTALVLYLVRPEHKAYAQLFRTLTIRSCRIDQTFSRIRVTDRLSSTIVAGEMAVGSLWGSVRVFVTGTTNLGQSSMVEGRAGSGYAGVAFAAELPVGMSFLDDIVVCLR